MVGNERQPRLVCPRDEVLIPDVSVIIPARNEARWLSGTLDAAIEAVEHFHDQNAENSHSAEIIVVDNGSTDGTWDLLTRYSAVYGIRPIRWAPLGAARARNQGRRMARGRLLLFVDADTHLPVDAIARILELCERGKEAGITWLAPLEGGWRAHCWWIFWGVVRRLPIPRAKAMPAAMFCTTLVFDEFGPFDEEVSIGEEWPILANVYRTRPGRFIYERSIVARTSSRRMEQQPFGYLRTFAKYVWAILDRRGRIHYSDQIR